MILDRTYQLNVAGNMDFMNMLERERLISKKISKTRAVTSQIDRAIAPENVHIGLRTRALARGPQVAYIRMEAATSVTPRSTWRSSSRSTTLRTQPGHHRRPALRQDRP